MGIISEPYMILMYNMNKFLQAVSEESYQTDGRTEWMDTQIHKRDFKVILWRGPISQEICTL